MRKNSVEYKQWLLKQSALKEYKRSRYRNRKRKGETVKKRIDYVEPIYDVKNIPEYPMSTVTAPSLFGFFINPDETVVFFNNLHNEIFDRQHNHIININLKNVTEIGVDALMYFMSLVDELKRMRKRGIRITVNRPLEDKPRRMIDESGFYDFYTNDRITSINPETESVKIKLNNCFDQTKVKEICDFINRMFETTRKDTKPIYDIISELMLNTIQHAYNELELKNNNWYLFSKHNNGKVEISFHDTGFGIPMTVTRRNFPEKIKKFISNAINIENQPELLLSSFDGTKRTRTEQGYRGKGLPRVYEYLAKGLISELKVITNSVYCAFDREHIRKSDLVKLKGNVRGTIYYFEFVPLSKQ